MFNARGGKPSHTHTWMQTLNPSTSAKPVMTKLQNLFVALVYTGRERFIRTRFNLIRSYCEIFFYHFLNISCLKCTVNSNFHLIRSKILPTNDFELTVPNLYGCLSDDTKMFLSSLVIRFCLLNRIRKDQVVLPME